MLPRHYHSPQSSLFKDLVSALRPANIHVCSPSTVASYRSLIPVHDACCSAQPFTYTQIYPHHSTTRRQWTPAFHIFLIHEPSNPLTLAMSNYHPPSISGTQFNPNGHVDSFAGSPDHSRSQYSYPYQNPSFLYGRGQNNGTPIAPQTHSNNHSFRSNAQDIMTPSSGNEVNAAPHAHCVGQVQYNAFPTSEYPPTPFAHAVPSYGVQPLNQPTTGSNPPSNPSHLFSSPHPAAEIQSADIEDPDTGPPALSELEDGELDDEEIGKATGQSRASTMTPLRVSQPKRHNNLNSADSECSHYAANAPDKPLPGLDQGRFLSNHC